MASIKRVGTLKNGTPVYDAQLWVNGKNVHRRLRGKKREVERQAAILEGMAGTGVTWTEGLSEYEKRAETKESTKVEYGRTVRRFAKESANLPIEETSARVVKQWLMRRAGEVSARTANKDLRHLKAVASWLRDHAGIVETLPFERVPALREKAPKKHPVPLEALPDYMQALPACLRNPVVMVLYAGLRSTAALEIALNDISDESIHVTDKFDTERDILRDPVLDQIIVSALAWREESDAGSDRLFVGLHGRPMDDTSLLHSCQLRWRKAGLEKRTIHDFRRTLGTEAGKIAHPDAIRAVMGHKDRASSESYVDTDEARARELRAELAPKVVGFLLGSAETEAYPTIQNTTQHNIVEASVMGAKVLIPKALAAELVVKYGVTE